MYLDAYPLVNVNQKLWKTTILKDGWINYFYGHFQEPMDDNQPLSTGYPLVYHPLALENGLFEIVDIYLFKMAIFKSFFYVYQRVTPHIGELAKFDGWAHHDEDMLQDASLDENHRRIWDFFLK